MIKNYLISFIIFATLPMIAQANSGEVSCHSQWGTLDVIVGNFHPYPGGAGYFALAIELSSNVVSYFKDEGFTLTQSRDLSSSDFGGRPITGNMLITRAGQRSLHEYRFMADDDTNGNHWSIFPESNGMQVLVTGAGKTKNWYFSSCNFY